MFTDAEFFAENAGHFRDGVYRDDSEYDLISLVVADNVPIEIVNAVLSSNIQDMGGARVLQLADTYDSLPNWDRNVAPEGTGDRNACRNLFLRTYDDCTGNQGIGGSIDVGCVRYSFHGGLDDAISTELSERGGTSNGIAIGKR
ncbi:hypothetical protein Q7P36_004641 [Cladosporium allicinum]